VSPLSFFFAFVLVLELITATIGSPKCRPIVANDVDRIQFALNLEFLEAEFFLYGALGRGLDHIAPNLAMGGPPPIGAKKANLDYITSWIIEEIQYEEVSHLRFYLFNVVLATVPSPCLFLKKLKKMINDEGNTVLSLCPRHLPSPLTVFLVVISYSLESSHNFANITIPNLASYTSKRLVGSLLGLEARHDAVIRTLLYKRANEIVIPYNITVVEFTIDISELKNRLAMCGIKDEGLIVPLELGAGNRADNNILSTDVNSLSYATPPKVLRILYGTGSEYRSGGFLPNVGNGKIAQKFLSKV
ncbi:LOW QUALITY PROTEIN: Ferritin_2 domain-containing protein, partial [Cephalotus follicularis]